MNTNKNTNPWLEIPASDYEGHMNSPYVDQLSMLSGLFRESLNDFECETIALLGAATGNGLEHIKNGESQKVTVIDINPEYLEILRNRYERNIKGLEIIEADLEVLQLDDGSYSLIFGGLVFEYINPDILIPKIRKWLKRGGVLVAVLQLPGERSGKITKTLFKSLELLNSVMRLVEPDYFKKIAKHAGLRLAAEKKIQSVSGKSFYAGYFQKQ